MLLQFGCTYTAPEPETIDILVIGDSALSSLLESDANALAWKTLFPTLVSRNLANSYYGTHRDILDNLIEYAGFYTNLNTPRLVLLDVGNENAPNAANKDPANQYQDFFNALQDDLSEGTESGVGIEDLIAQIKSMWPQTHVLIVNPLPALPNYDERVLVNNWSTFNAKAQLLATADKVSFIDLHSLLANVFYDKLSKAFKPLVDIDSGLSIAQWASWTEGDEYARFSAIYSSTHDSAFGINFLGRLLTAQAMSCPINAILIDDNEAFVCPALDLTQLNALRQSIVEHDVLAYGDSVMAGILGDAWDVTFPDYRSKKFNDAGQRHVGLMNQFKDNADLYSEIYEPKVVLINIGSNDKVALQGDTELEIFIRTQNEVAHGEYSGIDLNDINNQIFDIWPETSIIWMSPQARTNSFDKRPRLLPWTIFSEEASARATASDQVFFIDSHYAFTDMYYDALTSSFYWLGDSEPDLDAELAMDWTEENEYARFLTHWQTTHTDSVHLTKYGYMIFVTMLECPLRALIDDNNVNYSCADIVPADVDALRTLIP